MKALIGTKLGMTSLIREDGTAIGVTVVLAAPATVSQIKTAETDGYDAIQIVTGQSKHANKAQVGHVKPAKVPAGAFREWRGTDDLSVGDKVDVSIFTEGDLVSISGISKGKGWTGVIKRHNFHRQRKTHGAKGSTRRPGSIGSMYPQRVMKGKKMAGRSGGAKTSIKNSTVAFVDTENNLIGLIGSVPGPNKSQVWLEAVS